MLGLGDIVMPGLLLCFVFRYDSYKKSQLTNAECGFPPPPHPLNRVTYFHCSLIGYFVGKLACEGVMFLLASLHVAMYHLAQKHHLTYIAHF